MSSVFRYLTRNLCKLSGLRCSSKHYTRFINPINNCSINLTSVLSNSNIYGLGNGNISHKIENRRHFAKKKGSKRDFEEEESDDEEQEESESYPDELENVVTKSVPSMRLDTVLKAALGISKKKVETNFYAGKFRVNNEPVLKKAHTLFVGDEIDLVRGFSPDSSKFLLVDKVVIKSVGKVTGSCLYPVKMEIMKGLTIENYENPWKPSSISQLD